MLEELDIQITNKCMLNCKHCCCSSDKNQILGEPIERWINIVNDAKKLGVKRVDITGGEPYLRKDIGQLINELEYLDLKYEIQSTWIPKDSAEDSKRRIHVISMDGMEERHDYYRGKGSFNIASTKLKKLAEHKRGGLRVTTVVTASNEKDIEKLLEYTGSLNVDHHAFFCFSPLGRGAQILDDWSKPLEHLAVSERINDFVHNTKKKLPHKVSFQVGYSQPSGLWKDDIGCRAMGKDFLFILSDGEVLPCSWYLDTGFSLGNVFDLGLITIYENYLLHLEKMQSNSKKVCGECVNYSVCKGGCDAARVRFNSIIDPRCYDPTKYFPGCPEKKVTIYENT